MIKRLNGFFVVVTLSYLDTKISCFSDFTWPLRSPDLTALYFFLWGYLKCKVYANMPKTIQELKAIIREEVRALG